MSTIYQQISVFRFLKIAELWGHETNADMWTIARIMAFGIRPSQNENPLLIHHISMIDANGNHVEKGGFRNPSMIEALNALISDAPDHPTPLIINGLHDICISKDNFRHWCVEKYPLPHFWFTEKERSTFSQAVKIQIQRVGKLSVKELQKDDIEMIELKPTFQGFSVDLKKLYKYFRKKIKSNQAH